MLNLQLSLQYLAVLLAFSSLKPAWDGHWFLFVMYFWCSVLASPQSRSRHMLEDQGFQRNGSVFCSETDLLVRKWYFQGPQLFGTIGFGYWTV